ncbi:MAG: SagB/ThcOx family dehydrogenase [Okeania sp. SIO2H7]|nr:SagB/ThcOx family dehydrogenase [Okeania sp. SIO2H7]
MSFVLSFKNGISVGEGDGGDRQLLFSNSSSSLPLKELSGGLAAAFKLLGEGGATEAQMLDVVSEKDSFLGMVKFHHYLAKFISMGIVCHSVETEGVTIATLEPISFKNKIAFPEVIKDKKYRLSRFAYCHQQDSQFVVESPLFPGKVILKDWRGAALINELSQEKTAEELTKISGISIEIAEMFVKLLLGAKMVAAADENGNYFEEENETFRQWEFHDLLFHYRTRQGRHDYPLGKTQRFLGKLEPPPAVKPKIEGTEKIGLFKPDIEELKKSDRFTEVLEKRKSLRDYGDRPITAEQLGEFLYRSARVKEIFFIRNMERSHRPYAGGGACHELELYVVSDRCENLDSGLYHYCPLDHELEKISTITPPVESLLKKASQASGSGKRPQVLIILAARFQRMAWDYESMAYCAVLKHVGCLYQTMYLVATAMNLAPCALGTGDSDLFVEAAGTDYYVETSVGEFILGSREN